MAWADTLSLEIEAEFRRLAPTPFFAVEDRMWLARVQMLATWAEHGAWWRRTAIGRAYARSYYKRRAARMKLSVVAVRGCAACGKPFGVTAYNRARKRDKVCSAECRGKLRGNIKQVTVRGVSAPLAEHCKTYGVKLGTAWARIKRGWSVESALGLEARRAA